MRIAAASDAGDVSDSVYERETEILNKALNDRKAMQEKYYQDVDAMQQNGTAFINGFATGTSCHGSVQQH